MPDKWTQSLIPTSRQVPAEAEVPSHQLMLRAGLIRKLAAGTYSYLPLGLRSLDKAARIVREEMNRAGAVELLLPTLQPIELWERTGRREAYGQNLFVLTDRHGRQQALGPTHEEVITEIIGACVASYKDLPLTLYQIQTKFRDEFRPRFGVLRSREFLMKDAYSFHLNLEGPGSLDETYRKQYEAYTRIFTRCGLPYEIVEAASGPIGGSASHEFMVPSPTGEDVIFKSDKGNYAANIEKCAIGTRPHSLQGPTAAALEKILTPNCPGIDDVARLLKCQPRDMLKTLVFHGHTADKQSRYILAVVRGDHDINEGKLTDTVRQHDPAVTTVTLMDEDLAIDEGFIIGYVGPHIAADRSAIHLIVDPDAAQPHDWVTGANEKHHHVIHFNWQRDVLDASDTEPVIADIRNAVAGDRSPRDDGGILVETRGIELGHIFKLGAKYTDAMNVTVLDENNQPRRVLMGCYGIGVNRLLASAIEASGGHDENGIIWPVNLAPYRVLITPIKYEGRVQTVVDDLAAKLESRGLDVLIDDRNERPGVKFKDADLIGIPVRITVGEKGLAEDKVEVKARDGSNGPRGEAVAAAQAAARVGSMLDNG